MMLKRNLQIQTIWTLKTIQNTLLDIVKAKPSPVTLDKVNVEPWRDEISTAVVLLLKLIMEEMPRQKSKMIHEQI